ncbi:hypothetical protein MCOR07_000582 [Pyricularia oryzae]|uniref:Uncharacterized protein n=1 Tax=Pyricularia grisea TaxID=148305 RepID=A0ABQ8N385_PYRGI|nr:hypothetical protein MCOR01_011586 [Pyricularia oryzae]KAI6290504.1 hypothetical protein MCOR33_011248 [Pyricularia grisea]KAI6264803.1 hypothetical protein MCOR26_011114 [Pyricularia oryzae]KAI6301670.1 hypothetical protein MCOR29_010838 [Pyricularia oryzae]KAI6343511.1 hypothetical protein MCOR28_004763 [Pyricularia oryzae]
MYNVLDHPLNYKGAGLLNSEERRLMDLCHGNLRQISVIMDGLRGPMQAVNLIANAGTGTSAARLLLERIRQYTKKRYAATDTTSAGPEQEFQDIVKTMRAILVEVGIDKSRGKHERFLDSLDFPGREERQNNIRKAYTETFEWIFADSRFEDDNDSLNDGSLDDNAPLHNQVNETAADERSRNEAIDVSDRMPRGAYADLVKESNGFGRSIPESLSPAYGRRHQRRRSFMILTLVITRLSSCRQGNAVPPTWTSYGDGSPGNWELYSLEATQIGHHRWYSYPRKIGKARSTGFSPSSKSSQGVRREISYRMKR